ncbi:MAG: AlpA family phage regulatory protein [Bacteroidetes bacterium]|nr:AlpA family phage regulatory protein [Bacteroidota bacterium]
MIDENHPKLKILRRRELVALVGLSISACYEKMDMKSPRYDASFPKPIKLGKKAVGWVEAEVMNWLYNQMQLR